MPLGPNSLASDCDNARVANLAESRSWRSACYFSGTRFTHLAGAKAANFALPLILAVAPVKMRVPLDFFDISLKTA